MPCKVRRHLHYRAVRHQCEQVRQGRGCEARKERTSKVRPSLDLRTQKLTLIANALQPASSMPSWTKSKLPSQPALTLSKGEAVGRRTRWTAPPAFCLQRARSSRRFEGKTTLMPGYQHKFGGGKKALKVDRRGKIDLSSGYAMFTRFRDLTGQSKTTPEARRIIPWVA